MDTLFISDIHLTEQRPDKIELFTRLLRSTAAREAAALYILGDLFEYFWLGNDDHTPPAKKIINELAEFSRTGSKLFFIRGNRELFLDRGFEVLTGCVVLADMTVIELDGEKVLIAHGDRFCTKDIKYQIYRRFVETGIIRNIFLSLPYRARATLVHGLRPIMRMSVKNKPLDIIDVDQTAVEVAMQKNNVFLVIHGHTHRQGIHKFTLDGQEASRIVLSDWYQQDSVLVCNNGNYKMMRVEEYLDAR